ncbi:uncharacterized protein LOC125159345 isoform X6 [Prionailurus viverrinus]|uniref:uncharacterized protein LOC125159333 isoform X2 n=1 Tax=Prionailurus viverrinus TaxID=61388 RepID=UPI001FF317B1|nr:uncharacterized protein LOC125159333 isoform X2 [Prionailurus viverrinus]XP_047703521.1 uncharacterized protein LOC125159333 isoform X2 [Prionailurus viverrinus]XP_047703522.1 uncharacterized protein LOC125159333 isoform X2 [Prionailurus viverrinus]XP_047703523.1 uncharacterized protein LOC125159333 isoform X2 [Prionailurus viverrinus]XP_047703567.1 uncharacterized protein LOC125159345 isoform X6 [Prionailurus viverrinus]XP_047703568.1 uncharacterized protein LOC125159345 isoform X6 [Priona
MEASGPQSKDPLYKRVLLENYRHLVSLGQGITPLSCWPQSPPTWGSACPPGPHASKVHASRVHGGAHVAAQPRRPAGGGGRGAGGQLRGAGGLVRPEDPAACSGWGRVRGTGGGCWPPGRVSGGWGAGDPRSPPPAAPPWLTPHHRHPSWAPMVPFTDGETRRPGKRRTLHPGEGRGPRRAPEGGAKGRREGVGAPGVLEGAGDPARSKSFQASVCSRTATLVVVAGYPAWRWSDLAGAWRMNFRKVWEMHLANCHYQGVNFSNSRRIWNSVSECYCYYNFVVHFHPPTVRVGLPRQGPWSQLPAPVSRVPAPCALRLYNGSCMMPNAFQAAHWTSEEKFQ